MRSPAPPGCSLATCVVLRRRRRDGIPPYGEEAFFFVLFVFLVVSFLGGLKEVRSACGEIDRTRFSFASICAICGYSPRARSD